MSWWVSASDPGWGGCCVDRGFLLWGFIQVMSSLSVEVLPMRCQGDEAGG